MVRYSPALRGLGVPHTFTTRSSWAGVELGPQLIAELGASPGSPIVSLTQVHGAEVQRVTAAGVTPETCGDALTADFPGPVLLIRTADCVPVLASSLDGRRVAALHAGWRGIVAGVVPAALEALGAGAFDAAVGPCLSTAHFEVGHEVAEAFREAGLGDAVCFPGGAGDSGGSGGPDGPRGPGGARPHVDLRLAVRLQLERAGARRIDVSRSCTWDDAELFSYRRDVTHGGHAVTGRLGALIAVRAT